VPLERQDPTTWDARLIAEGESYLRRATRPGPPGRFQLEAAISAVHCDRARTGVTDWHALQVLYAALVTVAPSLGSQVARAAVTGRIDGPTAGLAALAELVAQDERRTHGVPALPRRASRPAGARGPSAGGGRRLPDRGRTLRAHPDPGVPAAARS
jgi:predicted RNA polymerase sigma factor